jgi:hypothetical protein
MIVSCALPIAFAACGEMPEEDAPPTETVSSAVTGMPTRVASGAGSATGTWKYQPLKWSPGGGQGGPVLSPEIVPVYWGKTTSNWKVGDGNQENDPNLINAWIDGFANYVSGAGAPAGAEPVTKQYGIWGAQRVTTTSGNFTCNGSCSSADTTIADTGVQQRIAAMQAAKTLPASTPNRIFLVMLKGFKYNFGGSVCGYHSLVGNTYYAVVPWEIASSAPEGSLANCTFQGVMSHELFETMTDPYPNNGWLAQNGQEGGDECQPYNSSYGPGAGDQGMAQMPFGFIQTFTDNVSNTCSPWSWSTTSNLALTNWPAHHEIVSAIFPAPASWGQPGEMYHIYTTDNVNWPVEDMGSIGGNFQAVQAPAVVKPTSTRLDVFVRGVDGPSTGLFHMSTTSTAVGWSAPSQIGGNTTVGQPSAVSAVNNRIDIAARHWDSSVLHLFSTNNSTFSTEDIASQTIGPPTIVASSPGSANFDVYTFGMHADQVVASEAAGGKFGAFGTLVSGVNGLLPIPGAAASFNTTDKISFAGMNGGNNPAFQEAQTYLPRFTATNTSGGWLNSYYAMTNTTPFGAYAIVSNSKGVDVAWMDRSTFEYFHRHFNAQTHAWSGVNNLANWDAVQDLGGNFIAPPALTYGSDGALYVMGVDINDCLGSIRVSGTSIAPSSTGLCGVL